MVMNTMKLTPEEVKERKRQRDRDYYYRNRDRVLRRVKARYDANPDPIKKYVSEYQLERKMKAIKLKGGKCERCPEDHPAALQFHHVDPSQKITVLTTKQFGSPKKYPWEMIEAELEKCILLCSNCHFKEHTQWTDEQIASFR